MDTPDESARTWRRRSRPIIVENRTEFPSRILRSIFPFFAIGLLFVFSAGATPLPQDKNVTVVTEETHIPQWKRLWDEARAFVLDQKYDEAIENYLAVLETKPHIEAVKWELSRTYSTTQDYAKALVILQGLLEASPGRTDYLVSAGEAALKQQQPERASRYFGKVLAAEPAGPQSQAALQGMIDALSAQGKNSLTVPLMEQLFRRGAADPGLLLSLARSYVLKRDMQTGAFYYRKLIGKYRVEDLILFEAASVYEKIADLEGAAELWERYLKTNPNRYQVRIKLADYYLDRATRQDALPHMLYLVEHGIDRERYLLSLARTYLYEAGRTDRALHYFEEYRREFPDGIDVSDEIAGLQLIVANDLLAIVENDGAWKLWRDLAFVTPDRLGIYLTMAEILGEIGKGKEAELIEILKIIHAHQPDDIEIISQLTEIYKKSGRFSECIRLLDQAKSFHKDRTDYYLIRAECEHGAGDDLGRLESFVSYLERKPDDPHMTVRALQLSGGLGLIDKLEEIHGKFPGKSGEIFTTADYVYTSELLRNGLARRAESFLNSFKKSGKAEHERMMLTREMAALDLSQNRPYKAERWIREYGAGNPDPVDGYLLLADFFITKNDVITAEFWHDAVLSYSGSLSDAHKSISFYQQLLIDRALMKIDVYNRALSYLNNRLKSNLLIAQDVDILLFSAGHYLETNRFDDCIELINRYRQKFDEVDHVAAMHVIAQYEKGSRFHSERSWTAGPMGNVPVSIQISVAEQLAKLGRFEDAETLLSRLVEELPESVRARVLLADVHMALLGYGEAAAIYEALGQEWEQESFFREQVFRIENLQGRAGQIFQEFSVEYDESGRKNRIASKHDSLNYTELKLMWARSLWSDEQWEESLDVYGLLDTEMKRALDRMAEELKQIPPDRLPLKLAGRLEDNLIFDHAEVIDLIMSNPFVLADINGAVAKTTSRYYDAYRWGSIIGKELTAKSSLKAREFYQAEIDYMALLQEEEAEVTEPVYSDLATVYGRLGRYREETELLEKLKETRAFYPELTQITEKNIRRRQPHLSVEGTYREEEGRDGAIDIVESSGGVGLLVRPSLYQDAGLHFKHTQYGEADSSSTLDSNTLLGEYRIQITDDIEGTTKLGLEDFSESGNTLFLYDLMLRGTLEQRVGLYGGITQVPVDDSVDALLDGIYLRDLQLGFSLDYFFGMFFGFDIDFLDYSDDNEGERYYLWGSYRWFGERSALDFTYSYLSLQHELTNELAEEAGAGYELPYWSPGDYWKHRLAARYKMELWPTGRLQSGTGSFSAQYGIGYEKGDSLIHEIDLNILLEITATFLVKGTFSTIVSDDYDQLKGNLSLMYRW